MSLYSVLKKRGFIDQTSSENLEKFLENPISVYLGFDPTADSIHLGNLVGLIALLWFQKHGHRPYVLLGGATGRIGDPSGKNIERPLLEEGQIEKNILCLKDFFEKIFSRFDGPCPVIVNNNDWFSSFSFIHFLRDVGKHFRMGPMLSKESVKQRIGQKEGMSFTEFSYQTIQGYDFYYLNKEYGVSLQIGGSDQWGNITAGIDYAKKRGQKEVYGLVHPLLTKSDGTKFGKSEGGAIWLDEKKLSPYQFYQHLYRTSDSDVIKLLKLLTFLEIEKIEEIAKNMEEKDYAPNTAQKILAQEVTRIVHGLEGLSTAEKVTQGASPGKDTVLDKHTLEQIAKDMPSCRLSKNQVLDQSIVSIALEIKLVSSKTEMRRLIQNKGAYLNNKRIESSDYTITDSDLIDSLYLLFAAGKKKKILVSVI